MKRNYISRKPTSRFVDAKRSLSKEQLAGIGAVAIAYNYAEQTIDRMLPPALGLTVTTYKGVVTRINGMDGKIEIIKDAALDLGMPEEMQKFLSVSLGQDNFGLFKKYRDAVIHTKIFDPALGIGELIERRGKHMQVLITAEALDSLYEHIVALTNEIFPFLRMFMNIRKAMNPARDDKEKKLLLADILTYFSQAQAHRNNRLSLKPLPKFPQEPEPPESPSPKK